MFVDFPIVFFSVFSRLYFVRSNCCYTLSFVCLSSVCLLRYVLWLSGMSQGVGNVTIGKGDVSFLLGINGICVTIRIASIFRKLPKVYVI